MHKLFRRAPMPIHPESRRGLSRSIQRDRCRLDPRTLEESLEAGRRESSNIFTRSRRKSSISSSRPSMSFNLSIPYTFCQSLDGLVCGRVGRAIEPRAAGCSQDGASVIYQSHISDKAAFLRDLDEDKLPRNSWHYP